MATRLAEVEPAGPVSWVINNDQLSQQTFPTPELQNNRNLIVPFASSEIAVGVLALPPARKPRKGFWNAIAQRLGQKEKLSTTRLKMEPPIPFDGALPGLHTPLSALHPYVVMEDRTRFGIGVWVPKSMIGQWSGEKERPQEFKLFSREIEVYRERQNVAVLVRLDGTTPIAEQRVHTGVAGLVRRELAVGVAGELAEGRDYASTVIVKRQVLERDEWSQAEKAKGEQEAEVYDLIFTTIAKRATRGNATFDQKGLVEVVVATCVEDHVTEIRTKPIPSSLIGSDYLGSDSLTLKSIEMNSFRGPTRGFRDSTIKGETRFENAQVKKVDLHTVRNMQPIARFRFALVGSGGPIFAQMAEAPAST